MSDTPNPHYLWERKTDTSLQFWPETSIERSLIKPTTPKEFTSTDPKEKVCAPPPLPFEILASRGIPHSAISEHSQSFYTSRSRENFNFVCYTTGGSAILKIDGKTIRLKKGSLFYASHRSEYTLQIPKRWKMFFFHLEKSQRWNYITDKVYIVRQTKYLDAITSPTIAYFNEVYKPERSFNLLDIYAETIEYLLRRELSEESKMWRNVDELIAEMKTGNVTIMQTKLVAKKLNMSIYELNKFCLKTYGEKFAKIVEKINMRRAKQMLASNKSISLVAKECCFANVHSFSRAFSRNFGMSPSDFLKSVF